MTPEVENLIRTCNRVIGWLEQIANDAAERSKDRRFPSLADANAADAKNYLATAGHIRKAVIAVTSAYGRIGGDNVS